VAGNIGAAAVRFAAGDLEKAIRDRVGAKEVDAARRHAADQLAPFVNALRGALDQTPVEAPAPSGTATPANPAESREAAAHLTALLSEFDPGAADFVEKHHAALRPLFDDGSWREFEQLVQGYAFADAQAHLEQALENLPAR
jgi:hypothetical protein